MIHTIGNIDVSLESIGSSTLSGVIPGETPIGLFVLKAVDRKSIDEWSAATLAWVAQWESAGRRYPYLALQDASGLPLHAAFTPYLQATLVEMAKCTPNVKGKTALVLPKSLMTRVARGTFSRFTQRYQPDEVIRMFFDTEEALAWLQE